MGTRARRGMGLVALLVLSAPACGGGGDDEQAADVALEPVVAIDPCGVLDADTASDLVGAEVEERAGEVPTSLARAVGCSYRLRDDGEDGSAIAASLVLGSTEEDPEVAVQEELSALEGTPGGTTVDDDAEVEGADAAAVVSSDGFVQVVYVVDEVVVVTTVDPVDPVDDAKVEAVVDFVERTVPRVKQAKEDADAGSTEAGGDAGTGDDTVQAEEIEGLWTGDWGTMAIEEEDGEVRAAYTHDEGRITGTFDDGVFTGRWTEVPSREGPSDAGSVEFRFAKTDDGTIALDGRWDYDGDDEPLGHDDWDLTLSEDEVPPELLAAFDDEESFDAP